MNEKLGIFLTNVIYCSSAESCSSGFLCIKGIENPNYGITNFDTFFSSLLTVINYFCFIKKLSLFKLEHWRDDLQL